MSPDCCSARMIVLGGSGEVGGVALDATGVGAVVGVPINIAAARLVAAGAGIVAMSAGDLGSDAAKNDNHVLDEAQGPSSARPKPGDPLPESARPDTAGRGWEGRVADNGRGEVWREAGEHQRAAGDAGATPTRYGSWSRTPDPNGYVRFYNEHGQPVTVEGKPGAEPPHPHPDPALMAPTTSLKDGTRDPRLRRQDVIIAKIDYGLHLWTADRLGDPRRPVRCWSVAAGTRRRLRSRWTSPDSPLPPELADVVGATVTQLLVARAVTWACGWRTSKRAGRRSLRGLASRRT